MLMFFIAPRREPWGIRQFWYCFFCLFLHFPPLFGEQKKKEVKKTMSERKESKQKAAEGIEEVESPNFFRFENLGDMAEGVLRETTRSEQFGFGIYTLEKDDGSMMRVHGSSDLDDKMSLFAKGMWVRIVFYDQKKMPKGTMKLFQVFRKKQIIQETG